MSREGEALDTLRWGDAETLNLLGTGAFANIVKSASKQLVKANWRWPLMWGLRIVIVPQLAQGETATFTVTFTVTIGVGQNSMDALFAYTIAPTAGVYPICINDLIEIPAADIQVTAKLTGAPGVGLVDNFQVGAFVAPTTEPHAGAHLLDLATGEQPGMRWMQNYPPGGSPQHPGTGIAFPQNPDPLHYQPRR